MAIDTLAICAFARTYLRALLESQFLLVENVVCSTILQSKTWDIFRNVANIILKNQLDILNVELAVPEKLIINFKF